MKMCLLIVEIFTTKKIPVYREIGKKEIQSQLDDSIE